MLQRPWASVALAVTLTFLGAGSQTAFAGPFPGCAATSLAAQDLSGCDLRGADFAGFRLNGKNLSNANLSGVMLVNLRLRGGGPGYVILTGANLRGATISFADGPAGFKLSFAEVDLTDAKLAGSFPRNAFTDAKLAEADMSAVVFSDSGLAKFARPASGIAGTPAKLPAGWVVTGGTLIGPWTDFSGVDVSGLDLSRADMTGATSGGSWVGGFVLGTVSGVPVGLPAGWTLKLGYLIGPGAWLGGADLRGCDLRSASLKGAFLFGADLSGCDLRGMDLSSAMVHFSATPPPGTGLSPFPNLSGAKLAGANLSRVSTGVVRGIPDSLPSGWIAHQWPGDSGLSSLIGPGANIDGANIDGLDLSAVDLSGISGGTSGAPVALPPNWTLRGGLLLGPKVDLRSGSIAGADLSGVDLSGALIDGVDAADAKLAGLTGEPELQSGPGGRLPVVIRGKPATVPDSWTVLCDDEFWRRKAGPRGWSKAHYCLVIGGSVSLDLPAILDRALAAQAEDKAADADLWTSSLIQSILNSARLRDRDLAKSNLEKASLENADLSGSDLSSSNLTDVDAGGTAIPADDGATSASARSAATARRGAKLFGANLAKVNLKGAKLKYAGLARVSSGGITGQPKALPSGWKLTVGYLVGPKANLAGANLAGAALSSIKLATATLSGVRSGGIKSKPSSLPSGWVCAGGFLLGPGANLAGSNLSGVDFGAASLAKANLTGANVTGARLARAKLENVTSSGLVGTPRSLPSGWKILAARFVRTG